MEFQLESTFYTLMIEQTLCMGADKWIMQSNQQGGLSLEGPVT